jgi:hypothetical protein
MWWSAWHDKSSLAPLIERVEEEMTDKLPRPPNGQGLHGPLTITTVIDKDALTVPGLSFCLRGVQRATGV